MSNNKNLNHIPQEKFSFVQRDGNIHDQKLETKARGYFADAFLRFSKNKSSVVAAWILLFLILFAVLSPIISPYDVTTKDEMFVNSPAFWRPVAELNLGILDGARTRVSQTEATMLSWRAIGEETGYEPLLGITGTQTEKIKYRGGYKDRVTYTIETNAYYEVGMVYRTFSHADFQKLQDWQNETGIQVIYPWVDSRDIADITNNPNIWYEVDNSGTAVLDENGNFTPVYCTNKSIEGAEYNSMRIEGDDGSYIYSSAVSGGVRARICYYNYYQYRHGTEPVYLFGTNAIGQDLFCAVGKGAQFSILFAICVSAINLTIGTNYGALQGYYGGWVDMVLDRICDILSGVPFVVVATLFQLHLAQKVGIVPSFLFAFVLTGWIGMSALTRKQFYRFKSQEFVMAARTLGASDWRLMFKHIFPNGLGTIITSCALVIPNVIYSETNMTYLGIVDLNSLVGTTLGSLLSNGQASLVAAPHALLWPSIYLALLMISFNLFGNGLRDAFNPSTRGAED